MADVLEFCRPEEIGVKPEWVADYVGEMNRRRKMCHSFLMMRHGKVFAEGYWKPFDENWLHRMYSVSKTFVSAAVGMLVDEGKISLKDRIVDYFPDQIGEGVHPLIAEMTIEDMLKMSTCHKYSTYTGQDMDWVHTFFHPHHEPDHPAGCEFRYDTSATYTLDVLVERITGKTFLEYLKDKALRELGFSENSWCVEAPEGYAWGGSGVECTTRDLTRFALIFANGGEIGGKRYLSEEYVRAAAAHQIDNGKIVNAMEGYGYGYQIWNTWKNSFSFCGMGGQLAICIPEKDFLFVCTSDMQGDADGYAMIYNVLWETVVDRMTDEPQPEDDTALAEMNELLASLEVNVPAGEADSPMAEKIGGTTYELAENRMGIGSFEINFDNNGGGALVYHTGRGDKVLPFRLAAYEDTTFPETHYSGRRINQPKGEEYRCLNAAVWTAPDKLLVRTYVIDDYFGNMAAEFTFDETGERVHLSVTKTAEWFLDEYAGQADGKRKA